MTTRKTPRTKTTVIGAGVAVAAAAVGLSWASSASGSQATVASLAASDSGQGSQVKAAFTAAISADRAALAEPASFVGSMASAAVGKTPANQIAAQPDATVRNKQLNDGLAALSEYFAPAQAQHEAIGLRNTVNDEAGGTERNLTSGVSKVTFSRVGVSGDKATVEAAVSVYGKTQVKMSNGDWNTVDPPGVMDYTATLVKSSAGQWVVSSMVGDFAPGEGP